MASVHCTKCQTVHSIAFDHRQRAIDPTCPSCGCAHWSYRPRGEVESLCRQHHALAKWCAGRVAKRFSADAIARIGWEEVEAEALVVLMRAARRFDTTRLSEKTGQSVQFTTFAVKALDRGIAQFISRECINHRPHISLDSAGDDDRAFEVEDHSPDPVGIRDDRARVHAGINRLDNRRRRIVVKRFLRGMTLQAIANDLGLTRERVRQLAADSVVKLKELMTDA